MIEAAALHKAFGLRLKEVPMSEVASNSKHEAMSPTAVSAFRKDAPWIPRDVPVILESVISPDNIEQEIKLAEFVLSRATSGETFRVTFFHALARFFRPCMALAPC